MGYFSNLTIGYIPYDHDCSYTLPEKQLLWRLEELQDRLEELTSKRRTYEDRVTFSEDNLRYVLPEHFLSASDVSKAIDLAISDLRERYGVFVGDTPEQDDPVMDEITGMQISFLDFLSAYSQNNSPYAA